MGSRVFLLGAFLSVGVHPSVWLEQLHLHGFWFHQYIFSFLYFSNLHLPLSDLSPLHGVLQLPGMCHGTPAGHDPSLHENLLEPAGTPEGGLSSSPSISAQGEEACLLPGSSPDFVRWLLDSSAPDELPAAVSWF